MSETHIPQIGDPYPVSTESDDWKEIATICHHEFDMMCNLLERPNMTIEKMKRHAVICRQGIEEALQNPEQRKSRCGALAAIAMATKGNAP